MQVPLYFFCKFYLASGGIKRQSSQFKKSLTDNKKSSVSTRMKKKNYSLIPCTPSYQVIFRDLCATVNQLPKFSFL